MSVWDDDPVNCPFGHPRLVCQRVHVRRAPNEEHQVPSLFCIIKQKEDRKAKTEKDRLAREKVREQLIASFTLKEDPPPPPPQRCVTRKGTWRKSGPNNMCHIKLVCLHEVMYNRSHFDEHEQLWCSRCRDWKHIHEYTNVKEEGASFFVYLPEVPPSSGSRLTTPKYDPRIVAANNKYLPA